jgi:hypothetical protein
MVGFKSLSRDLLLIRRRIKSDDVQTVCKNTHYIFAGQSQSTIYRIECALPIHVAGKSSNLGSFFAMGWGLVHGLKLCRAISIEETSFAFPPILPPGIRD